MVVTVPAPPSLAGVVDRLWIAPVAPGGSAERRLPDGASELVIRLDGEPIRVREDAGSPVIELGGGAIAGPRSRSFVIDASGPACMVGAHFRPGGAFPFMGMRADELHNCHAPLADLWGGGAAELRERLADAGDARAQLDVLTRALEARLRGFRHRHPALPHAVGALTAGAPIGAVAGDVGLSWRRLIEVFRQEVGLTPKLFVRVQRFQAVLRALEAGRGVDWAETALACGYYDQAHCIRDFRAFAALTPGRYAAAPRPWRNHVPL